MATPSPALLDAVAPLNQIIPIDNGLFRGSILVRTSTGPGSERHAAYFAGRRRCLEIQVQGRFLVPVLPGGGDGRIVFEDFAPPRRRSFAFMSAAAGVPCEGEEGKEGEEGEERHVEFKEKTDKSASGLHFRRRFTRGFSSRNQLANQCIENMQDKEEIPMVVVKYVSFVSAGTSKNHYTTNWYQCSEMCTLRNEKFHLLLAVAET